MLLDKFIVWKEHACLIGWVIILSYNRMDKIGVQYYSQDNHPTVVLVSQILNLNFDFPHQQIFRSNIYVWKLFESISRVGVVNWDIIAFLAIEMKVIY